MIQAGTTISISFEILYLLVKKHHLFEIPNLCLAAGLKQWQTSREAANETRENIRYYNHVNLQMMVFYTFSQYFFCNKYKITVENPNRKWLIT